MNTDTPKPGPGVKSGADPSPNPSPDSGAPRPGGKLRIALAVSLGINLLVIGAVAGAVFTGGPRRGAPPGEYNIAAPYIAGFAERERRALLRTLRRMGNDRAALRASIDADYRRIADLMRAEPFDRAAVLAAMETQLDPIETAMATGRRLVIERVAQMSPAERRAYADQLELSVAQMHRRKGAPKHGGARPAGEDAARE